MMLLTINQSPRQPDPPFKGDRHEQVKNGLFDEAGNLGAGSRQFLQKWMDRYVAWVKKLAA